MLMHLHNPILTQMQRKRRNRFSKEVLYDTETLNFLQQDLCKSGITLLLLAVGLVVIFGCADPNTQRKSETTDSTSPPSSDAVDKKIKIGLSMDSLRVERWQKDRDIFTAEAEKLGAEVIVQSADGDERRQNEQVENMITQGVDVLVVIPKDSVAAAQIVQAAHAEGIKVIAYDRLIRESSPDLYISFDNEKVGYLQAEYLLRQQPKGDYFLLGGAPTDNNAQLLRKGQMRALQTAIDSGDIRLVADGQHWAVNWDPRDALKKAEQVLTQTNNRVDAVVASNDGTAGGVIQALEGQNLAGKCSRFWTGCRACCVSTDCQRHTNNDGLQTDSPDCHQSSASRRCTRKGRDNH